VGWSMSAEIGYNQASSGALLEDSDIVIYLFLSL
jgi:hypothetical protein